METVFWFFAAFLLLLAIALLFVPWWRHRSQNDTADAGKTHPIALIIPALALPVVALGLYLYLGSYQYVDPPVVSGQSEQLPSVADMVVQLERRLQQNPNDPNGWAMLGRSYIALGRYPEAVTAYRQARDSVNDQNLDLRIAYAEALTLADPAMLTGEAGALFEEALATRPDDPKSLYYGGALAWERRDYGLAADRWERLLSLSPPEQIKHMLEQRIAAARAQVEGEAPAVAATPVTPSAASDDGLSLEVSVAQDLAAKIQPQASLFVMARSVTGGPPVAVVRRQAGELPLTVQLSDANSMVAGVKLSDFETVHLTARVSLNGSPLAQPGDLFGEIQDFQPGNADGNVAIVIDRIVQ